MRCTVAAPAGCRLATSPRPVCVFSIANKRSIAPTRGRQLRRPLSVAQEAAPVEGADGTGSSAEVVPMAASLVERAKIAASTGEVDQSFKETFVSELEAELEALQKRAAEAESMASALEETLKATKDQFVRLNADFENFRKRTAGEKEALRSSVKGDTVMALVPLIDNFELAKGQLKPETEGEQMIDAAYQGLYKQMVELFRSLGVEAVPGVGSAFDPSVHDAIMREPSEDVPEDTVLEEFRKGFRLGDLLLRPAMVKVSFSTSGSAPAAAPAPEEQQEAAASSESE